MLVSFDLSDVWWDAFLNFTLLYNLINLFVQSDNSSLGTLCSLSSRLPYLTPFPAFFSYLLLSHHFLFYHLLFFPSLLSTFIPLFPPPTPVPFSGLSLYSLIAHNHSHSVSVTNRPIRVGSRPYGRQAASVMVSTICFLPSTCGERISFV